MPEMIPLVRHPPGQHFPWCGGPDDCLEYRDMLDETPRQAAARCRRETEQRMRAASHGDLRLASAFVLRTGVHMAPSQPRHTIRKEANVPMKAFEEWCEHHGVKITRDQPDVWRTINRHADPPDPREDPGYNPHGEPADGYEIALRRRQK